MCKATDAARRPAEITKSGHGGKMHFFAFEVIVRKDPPSNKFGNRPKAESSSFLILYLTLIASATPTEEINEIANRRGISEYFIKIYGSPESKSSIVKSITKSEKFNLIELEMIKDIILNNINEEITKLGH